MRASRIPVLAVLAASGSALAGAAGLPGTAGASGPPRDHTVVVSSTEVHGVGDVLTTGSGLTLYRFTADSPGKATCTGVCAKVWPPYLAAKGAHIHGPRGLHGLSLIAVGGGHHQVAYHDAALYRFAADKKKGQAKGQGFVGKWYAVSKSWAPAAASAHSGAGSTHMGTSTTSTTSGAYHY